MLFSSTAVSDTHALLSALHAAQAVIEFMPDGRILTANENFLKVTGYGLHEIEGKHHGLFVARAYAGSDDYAGFWRRLANGQSHSGEFKRFNKAGEAIWLQASYNPIRDRSGRVVKVVKFAADITQSKLTDIDRKGKIEAIGRAQAVIEFTPDGKVLTANDNFLKVMGYALAEIEGQPHSLFCDPDYVQSPAYKDFWTDLRAGKLQADEYRRVGKGGCEVYIQANYNPVFDDTGHIVKIVKFATDITASVQRRLRNEAISRDINRDLGNVVDQVATATDMASGAGHASIDTHALINSVAAASEELSHSVRDISQSMTLARDGVEKVFRHAEQANSQAGQLNTSAAAMTNIVTLIHGIAGQINLLALNATIESARAGEAGRGFAVVASEVKNLANQAGNSTKTIAAEIATMQTISTQVVDALTLISGAMTAVLENVVSIAGAIDQQNMVTGEITSNMHSAVTAVGQIQSSLERINHTFGAVAQTSEKVKRDVEALVA